MKTQFWSLVLLVIVLSWSLGPSVSLAQSPEIQGRIKFERANRAMTVEKYETALRLYEEVNELMGPFPKLLYRAAQAAHETGEFEKAQKYVMQVLATEDADFNTSDDYNAAFGLAASIEDALEEKQTKAQPEELAREQAPQEQFAAEQQRWTAQQARREEKFRRRAEEARGAQEPPLIAKAPA